MHQVFYYKMQQFYYKDEYLLQNVAVLFQNAAFIIKVNVSYKMRRYTPVSDFYVLIMWTSAQLLV